MSDLEGLTRKLISKGMSIEEVKDRLIDEILIYKDYLGKKSAESLANAIIDEVRDSSNIPKSNLVR
mgnify:CR=1 FL=1